MSAYERALFLEELAVLGLLPPALAGVSPAVREELASLARLAQEVTS